MLWGCAAWAGWSVATGPLRWLLALLAFVVTVGVWAVFAAPRAARRLPLRPRLALIAGLGGIVALAFLSVDHGVGAATATIAALAVVLAQWRDEASAHR